MNHQNKNLDPLMERAWSDLQIKLDQQMPLPTSAKRRKYLLLWIFLPGFLVSGALAIMYLNPSSSKNHLRNSLPTEKSKSLAVVTDNQIPAKDSKEVEIPGKKLESKENLSSSIKELRDVESKNTKPNLQNQKFRFVPNSHHLALDKQSFSKITTENESENENGLEIRSERAPQQIVKAIAVTPASVIYQKHAILTSTPYLKVTSKKPHRANIWTISAGPQFAFRGSTLSGGGGLSLQLQRKISEKWSLSSELSYHRYPKKSIAANDFRALDKVNEDLESFTTDDRDFLAKLKSGIHELNINASVHYHINGGIQISSGFGYTCDLFRYEGIYIDPITALPGNTTEALNIQKHQFQLQAGVSYSLHSKWTLQTKIYFLESPINFNETAQFKNQWVIGLNYHF